MPKPACLPSSPDHTHACPVWQYVSAHPATGVRVTQPLGQSCGRYAKSMAISCENGSVGCTKCQPCLKFLWFRAFSWGCQRHEMASDPESCIFIITVSAHMIQLQIYLSHPETQGAHLNGKRHLSSDTKKCLSVPVRKAP